MRFHRPRPLQTRPTASVVIPCYNYGRFLPDAVRSALDQPGIDIEVIVVDDCSTDGSGAVAACIAAADKRVTLVEHATNQGHIATYNDGLKRATGDYVALLSADDRLTSGSLTRSLALMEAHPDVVLVYGFPETFTDTVPDVSTRVTSWTTWDGAEWIARTCARGRNIVVNPEAVVRRTDLEALGWYDAAHPHAADMKLWMELATRGRVGRVNGAVQALYRMHGANMHTTRFAGVLTDLRESRRVFDTVLGASQRSGGHTADLQRRASRSLAKEALLNAGVLQAERDESAAVTVTELSRFAVSCDPGVARSRRMQAVRRRAASGTGELESRLLQSAWRARWTLRWRRWRRFGT